MHFIHLDNISEWSVSSYEHRYCPLTERKYLVCSHFQPAVLLDDAEHYTVFVN
ncbi:hypothetical protein GGQ13_003027 [Salinibacter ruber]|uniref:hypothetical protein n=1 Tax=Salinibacter ruber TaxID=146919 RepID=UPI00216A11F0|nr:hypothetical protein [Salinibacter ruber]MCS4139572.1 hypothetical protein [Salinibacter ruber]